jgi:hypothetical protein
MSKDDPALGFDSIEKRIESITSSSSPDPLCGQSVLSAGHDAESIEGHRNRARHAADTASAAHHSTPTGFSGSRPRSIINNAVDNLLALHRNYISPYRGRIVLVLFILFIVYLANQPGSNTPSVKKPSRTELYATITANKAKINQMSTELDALRSQIDLASNDIDSLKMRIRNNEAFGIDPSSLIYRHNSRVNQHNSYLRDYDDLYSRYSSLIASTNGLIKEYNSRRR